MSDLVSAPKSMGQDNPGTVLQEIQPGYFYKDRLLRPSFVAIAKKKDDKKTLINMITHLQYLPYILHPQYL